MIYEVELKFPLQTPRETLEMLLECGAQRGSPLEQRDSYFAHPNRDFAETDEALRVRCVGEENFITYKGPLDDSLTKTRHEIEVPFAAGAEVADQLGQLLQALGFRPVREVVKTRVPLQLVCDGREVSIALDTVDGLGSFLELEILAGRSSRQEAQHCILRLAERLGLDNPERRSYLSLLLQRDTV